MNENRQRYIYHLDELRQKKNITVKELCEVSKSSKRNYICSDRQYRKYLSGINHISDMRISEFCENLGISTRDFYYTLNERDQYIYDSIKNIYNSILSKNIKRVILLLDEFTTEGELTNQNYRFLEYCRIRFYYEDKRLLPDETIAKIKKHIPYFECDDCEAFDFVDALFLLLLAKIETTNQRDEGLRVLIRVLNNSEMLYLSAENRNILPTIYANTSLMLGSLNRLMECIEVSMKGIEFCKKYSFHKSLTRLYYSCSLSHKKLGHQSKSQKYAMLCMSNAIAINNKNEINHFYMNLQEDYKKDPFLLFYELKEDTLKMPPI